MTKQQTSGVKPSLIMVDDDEEDVYLAKRAFCGQDENLIFNSVSDKDGLFEYLNRTEKLPKSSEGTIPQVILLDINIPRENGFEILKQLKESQSFQHIPVVIFTTSGAEKDVLNAYKLGASSFISKSVNAKDMKNIASNFLNYWFNLIRVPSVPT